MPLQILRLTNRTEENLKIAKNFDYFALSQFLILFVLSALHLYFHFSRKKILVTYTPFFYRFFQLHLLYLILFCSIVLFSTLIQSVSLAALFLFVALFLTSLYVFTNITGTFLIITLLNSVEIVFSLNVTRRKTSWIIILIYVIWSHSCNIYDPIALQLQSRHGENEFEVNPLHIFVLFVTSILFFYRVLVIRNSQKRPLILDSCRLIQLILTSAVVQIYMLINDSTAFSGSFKRRTTCTNDTFLVFLAASVHMIHFLSALFAEQWYFRTARVSPEEECSEHNSNYE